MAARDEQAPINWFSPLDALRRVQELGAQLSGTARSFIEPQERDDAEYDTDEDQTIRREGDRQRQLADRFSELADRHRELSEGVMSTLTPTLDHLDRLAGRTSAKQAAKSSKTATGSSSKARKRAAR